MFALHISIFTIFFSGVIAAVFNKSSRKASLLGAGGAIAGSIIGLQSVVRIILGGITQYNEGIEVFTFGSLSTGIDQLSAFFLIPLFILVIMTTIYGVKYLAPWYEKKSIGSFWFFFNLLVSSMIVLILARNGMFFLVVWEIMTISSYFLVTFESEHKSVRKAGIIYLVASHIGVVFLFFLFVILGRVCGSMEFVSFSAHTKDIAPVASVLFVCSIIGFGVKAGFMPFHVWLPLAHPAAPSHVSALMSAIMIKTGIYGLLRMLIFIGPPEIWWGMTLLGIGLVSGIVGVLFALAQHDIKRLLAYHSVENIGIITIGIGLGLIGLSRREPLLALFGFAGGILHVLNHALFKGLLFLGAGAVVQQTGTRDIEHLGGLLKRMPVVGITFIIGSAAIAGLPPLNGFASEFIIYLGALNGIIAANRNLFLPSLLVIVGLAFIGTLAVACFAKVSGVVFLGEPRTEEAAKASGSAKMMQFSMISLAALCVLVGVSLPLIIPHLGGMLKEVSGLPISIIDPFLLKLKRGFIWINSIYCFFGIMVVILLGIRKKMLINKSVRVSTTWGCGYDNPSAKMQYTGSSFVQPITDFFNFILRTKRIEKRPKVIFPKKVSLHTDTPDIVMGWGYEPFFAWIYSLTVKLRRIQHGRVQLYILYIVVTLLALLIWKLG